MSEEVEVGLPYERIPINQEVSLRQLQPNEADDLFALVDSNRKYLAKWLPWVDQTKSARDSQHFITEILRKRREGSEFGYAIILNDKPAGHISLMHLSDGKDPEIGYWITAEASGRGITSQATEAITEFGFKTLGLPKIVIKAQPSNAASNKIAEKLGYALEDTSYNEAGNPVNVWSKSNLAIE